MGGSKRKKEEEDADHDHSENDNNSKKSEGTEDATEDGGKSSSETKEQKQERKRLKKEAKKAKKEEKKRLKQEKKRRKKEAKEQQQQQSGSSSSKKQQENEDETEKSERDNLLTKRSIDQEEGTREQAAGVASATAQDADNDNLQLLDLLRREEEENKEQEGDNPATAAVNNKNVYSVKHVEFTVSLLPAQALAQNCSTNVEQAMQRYLSKYCYGVDGAILCYDNFTILNDGMGRIYNEQYHIHFDVACDVLVFRPSVDSFLTGVVTGSFYSHVSMLVLNTFNASVPNRDLKTAGFELRQPPNGGGDCIWRLGETILAPGQKLTFTVKKVNECYGDISIEGAQPHVPPTGGAKKAALSVRL